MNDDAACAQRWHDTDHGTAIGPALRDTRFRRAVPLPVREYVSACWCCCELCNPLWNPQRCNPYWTRAAR
jgi:hypothetical protein